jgi:hypothetical protein
VIDDGSNPLVRVAQNLSITAGQGVTLNWYGHPFVGSDFGLNFFFWMDSSLILGPGFRIRTQINNLQAGDQLSAIQYLVEEWQTQ